MPAAQILTPEQMDVLVRLANGATCDSMHHFGKGPSDYHLSDGKTVRHETFKSLQTRGFIKISRYMVSLTEKARRAVMEVA